jgi:hypothetical protein
MDELVIEIGRRAEPLFVETSSASSAPITRQRDAHQAQLLRWIGDTLTITARVAHEPTEMLPLFWIRLYGLLTDVTDFVELTVEQSHDGLCMFPLARTRTARSPLPTALARLRAVFEEDELLYIEYRRHAECDPFQTKYRSRRGALAAHVPSVLLEGRPVTVASAHAAFDKVLAVHGGSEERVGNAFARRVLPALHALDAAARAE